MILNSTFRSGLGLALVVVPIIALLPNGASADTLPALDWTSGTSPGPSARISAYMSYDSARGRIVLFGGYESTSATYDADTWEYDGTTWTQVATAGPPAAGLGEMAFDSARGVSVLFGGGNNSNIVPPATWEWNGSAWTQRVTAHAPPARVWSAMTYDSTRHVTVLFGGNVGLGVALADTWEYDGTDWRQVVTAHAPSARYAHGLAFDSSRGRTVLFGGWTATGRVNDTWEYDGTDWTQVAATNPPAPRLLHSMVYDAALDRVVVFGGDYVVPGSLGPNSETWLYDGSAWQQLMTTDHPSARVMAPAAYDTLHASLVIFGGTAEGFPQVALGDTWALGPIQTSPVAALSRASIAFPAQPVLGVATEPVTLTNLGTAPLAITSVGAGGDFGSTDNCPRSPAAMQPGSACTITVSFSPSSGNGSAITGSLTLADNAGTGTQSIPLSGSGQWGFLEISAPSVNFGTSVINRSGPTAAVNETITIPAQPTILTGFEASPPFTVTNLSCPIGVPLSYGRTCQVQVQFSPTTIGSFSGQLILHDNEPGLQRSIPLDGTAVGEPIPIRLQVSTTGITFTPTFGHTLNVLALTDASSGTASFSFNGHQVGTVALTAGYANQSILLDDSVIPSGAGTYLLVVAIHSTDPSFSDNSLTQSITVSPVPESLKWSGAGLTVTGTPTLLSVTVAPPFGETQYYDFSNHPVWVRFDVTSGSGATSAYYAQVKDVITPSGYFGQGTASIAVPALTAGAYRVRARLVSASPSGTPNLYAGSEDQMSAFALEPARGGFIAGTGQQNGMALAFEFAPGSTPTGAFHWVSATSVIGSDGQWHDAYQVIVSTSVATLTSHSHTVTAAGLASVAIVDAVTGAHYPAFDQVTTFQLSFGSDGFVNLTTGFQNWGGTLSPGPAVNRL